MNPDPITYFAETDMRNKRVPFGIKASDRTRHVYTIGKTGMGKSTLLENMAIQDIKNGEGIAFIDPHGKTADLLLEYIPQERIKDIIYFAPFDLEHPISFNVMEDVGHDRRHLVANGLMSAFKKIWVDAWSARMEYILNNIILALLEYPDSTLIGVNRMLADKDYRKKVVENVSDPSVKAFWLDEFAKYGERYMQEAGAAIQNKIGQFISNPVVRNIIGQSKSTFDIRKCMDDKKILIVNLSKGRVGEANANLLGSMLITKIYLAAMSRADASPSMLKRMPNFYLYVDEFQSFANESFADILSEARKYKLNLTIAHQYIEQMSEEVRAAVIGNVGTMIVFRIGSFDAEVLEKEFFPTFTKEDLVSIGQFQMYLKLMIDGVSSQPFSATGLPPIEKPVITFKEDIIKYSRTTFARPRAEVEEAIRKWHEPIIADDRKKLSTAEIKTNELKRLDNAPKAQSQPKSSNPNSVTAINSRETELRNAIRLNYLKNEPKPEKKEKPKKGPTPQNMSALRDALSSVLGTTITVQTQPAEAPAPTPAPIRIVEERKEQPKPVSQQPEQKREAPKEVPKEIPKEQPKAERKPEPTPFVSAKPKEIPEDVLRRILELDK
ncbi:MAG: type IV secretory system conjugative DNA transfer family protein [Patescibacteria group bacterium]